MAELLLLKRKHFAEDVKPAQWSDLKWMARPRTGDVIEVRENGFFRVEALGEGIHGWDRNAFCLVRAPRVTLAEALYLMDSYDNGTETTATTIRYKRRYRAVDLFSLPWTKNTVTINGVTVEEWYRDYTKWTDLTVAMVDKVTA
jgi:hypothetical protein